MTGHTQGHIDCPICDEHRKAMQTKLSPEMTVSVASILWLDSLEFHGSARHRYISPRWLKDLTQYFRAMDSFFGTMRLCDIDAANFAGYQQERAAAAGPIKINQELAALSRLMRKANCWTQEIEELYWPLQQPFPDVQRALSLDEQLRMLDVAASRESWQLVYWYLILALRTTASGCEMRGLRRADFNLGSGILQIRTIHAKNRFRVRTIPLPDDAIWAAEQILARAKGLGSVEPQHFVFPFSPARNHYLPDKPMSETGIRKAFEEIRKAAGVPWLRIHDLRHTAITRLAEAGEPIPVILSIAGHVSQRMQQHYTQISEQAKRKAVNAAQNMGRKNVQTAQGTQPIVRYREAQRNAG